ncbi:MAG TPA: hypothetical protein DEG17_17240 [Cyanobacteria bacterium UBA11149]|nr:hypothetical protein [Cyanobacteria bacterium UBA11367]HBE58008.1 hypothetical protein [Cyanobacteria bacterium UBA11366]HBK66288.1 hypothetical protein [Cyanobacteria bacterium UBA11166]HBR72398.1 hypothetical protein [Cyanobacteria bacterium UBA11159]HBS71753.1 hypothetical protein [Cyanobacteria bacterium UBA11153]HBW90567.1 hypothetical protein [Cyanobacteria bacterium UBA11149]HCA93956.1 hypothetical protein [Cyanobacteria bacterium UBA9226]
MKVIDISLDSISLATLLTEARHQNLILRTPDGVEFILAEFNDFDREIELTRQNKEFMEFLDERGQETKTLSVAEVRARLGLTSD